MAATPKVTYISLGADDPVLDAAFASAVTKVRGELGRSYPLHVAGDTRAGATPIESRSPADARTVVARVASATAEDVRDAVAAAKAAFPAWSATPWQERAALLDRAADIVRERRLELAAWLIFEMGKNRVEALGEIE
jgi:1-pyrroline-5-carboxylate dehydrogenase